MSIPDINPSYAVSIVQDSSKTYVTAPMPETFEYDSQSEYAAPFSQGILGNTAIANIARLAGIRLTTQVLTAQIWQGTTEINLTLELEFHSEGDTIRDVRNPILSLLKLSTASKGKNNHLITSPGPSLDLDRTIDLAKATGSELWSNSKTAVSKLAAAATTLNPSIKVQVGQLTSSDSSTNGSNNSTPDVSNSILEKQNFMKFITNPISIQVGNYAFFDAVVITDVRKTYTSNIDMTTGWPQHAKVAISFRPMFLVLQDDLETIFKVRSNEDLTRNLRLGLSDNNPFKIGV